MKLRKLLCLVLALLMIAALTACSGGVTGGAPAATQDGAAGTDGADSSAGDEASTPAEGTSVDVLTWSNAATVEYLKSIADAFHEAYPDHYLTVSEVPSAEIDQVIQTRISAANVDIVSFQTFSKPQEEWNQDSIDKPAWQQYIDEGLLLDLTDQPFIDNYNLDILMGNSYKDRLYSLNMGTVAYTGLFYNKAIFSELGLEIPKTWDEFIAVCEAVKADGRYTVLSAGAADQWPLNMYANAILSANYGDGAEEIGQKLLTGEMKHTDPEVMLVYDCMEQFATYLEPGVSGIAYSDAPGRFAAGNMAMYADGSWSAPDILRANPDIEFGYFPLPGIEPREDGLDPQYGIKYDLSFAVPTNAPNQEGALAFLTYISDKEVYTAFLNAVAGFSPTQNDITLDNEFLNSLNEGLQSPCLNAEMYIYAPKGVGEYGNGQFSFLYLQTLGGPLTGAELAQKADEDFETARAALESLNN